MKVVTFFYRNSFETKLDTDLLFLSSNKIEVPRIFLMKLQIYIVFRLGYFPSKFSPNIFIDDHSCVN